MSPSNPLVKDNSAADTDTAHAHAHAHAHTNMKLGRKGDPRMHRAVHARLGNPTMPLVDALRLGGFEFGGDGHDSTIVDADNVTLGQRKNQLSRRLRLAKQQIENRASPSVMSGKANQQDAAPKKRGHASFTDPSTGQEIEDDVDMGDDNFDRMAKFHPSYHPLLFPRQTATPRLAPASGTAVASLVSTASAVGLTLEQLAMRLSDTPTLFQTLSTSPDPQTKLHLAVNLYKTDSRALLQKCMLHAGFSAEEVVEGNAAYMQVALKAWEVEGKRLELLLGCVTDGRELCECLPGVGSNTTSTQRQGKPISGTGSSIKSAHSDSCTDLQGRHVHRLAGKCGHKAIIHQPKGRPAHIDFVVDGKIECYEGIKPVGPKGQGALWPSLHKCIDLACPTDPSRQIAACGSHAASGTTNSTYNASMAIGPASITGASAADDSPSLGPKQLSLTDVDFDGKEWNVDFFQHDGQDDTLMGLMKLGDGDSDKGTDLPAPE